MWDDTKALDATAATLCTITVLAVAASMVAWLARQPAFAIREVVVTTPLARASAPHLETALRDRVSGTFFTIDLEAAREALGGVPWVRSVALRRQWPGRLEVAVEEHVPLARLSDTVLVNTLGEPFVAKSDLATPRFSGPEARSLDMLQHYHAFSALLAPLQFEIVELSLSPRGGWRLLTRGAGPALTLELGRDEPAERLTRFTAAHARTVGLLAREGTRVEYVDLRYRNGFTARVPGFREGMVKRSPGSPARPTPAVPVPRGTVPQVSPSQPATARPGPARNDDLTDALT